MSTWQPLTEADTNPHAQYLALPFVLTDAERAQAIAARYYIQQHVRQLNERASTKEKKR